MTPASRRIASAASVMVVVAVAAWLGGFAWFVLRATRPDIAVPPHADGIVALTGGAGRVEEALRLLDEGHADRLLVSGTGGGAELPELARLANLNPAPLSNRVTLGREATTTDGNAIETARWARLHHVRSLIVVTADYHMPRALVEIGRVAPELALYPHSVVSAEARSGEPVRLRLLAGEFTKWLIARSGLRGMVVGNGAQLHRDALIG